jgi:hypothetical protein
VAFPIVAVDEIIIPFLYKSTWAVEGMTLVHLTTASMIIHVCAIHIIAHDVIGIISEHHMRWTLKY